MNNNMKPKSSLTTCPQCPEGRGAAEECGPGFHAPSKGMTACEVCPDGQQCYGGTNITNCELGHYCSGGVKTPCPTGTFLDNVSFNLLILCTLLCLKVV